LFCILSFYGIKNEIWKNNFIEIFKAKSNNNNNNNKKLTIERDLTRRTQRGDNTCTYWQ